MSVTNRKPVKPASLTFTELIIDFIGVAKWFFEKVMREIEVNGRWPEFTGKVLQELIVQEFWYEGLLEEQANVVYIKVAGQWSRLYFDSGIVFWRECEEGFERERVARADDAIYPLVDLAETLGLKGVTIVSCCGRLISNGSEIEFAFKEEKPLIFQCVDDNTSVKIQ